MANFGSGGSAREINRGRELCVLPLMSQLSVFNDSVEEIGIWHMKLHRCPIIAIADKAIEMLRIPGNPEGRETCDLIFDELGRQREEINLDLAKGETYEAIKMVIRFLRITHCAI